jgi:wobble nucleotide-excising tRNase
MENTQNWQDFGYREIEEAKELLSHIKEIDSHGKVNVEFNPNSGNVFLVDEDYRVWMMNGDDIEEFHTCSYCGNEGFAEDIESYHDEDCEGCKELLEYLKGGDS